MLMAGRFPNLPVALGSLGPTVINRRAYFMAEAEMCPNLLSAACSGVVEGKRPGDVGSNVFKSLKMAKE